MPSEFKERFFWISILWDSHLSEGHGRDELVLASCPLPPSSLVACHLEPTKLLDPKASITTMMKHVFLYMICWNFKHPIQFICLRDRLLLVLLAMIAQVKPGLAKPMTMSWFLHHSLPASRTCCQCSPHHGTYHGRWWHHRDRLPSKRIHHQCHGIHQQNRMYQQYLPVPIHPNWGRATPKLWADFLDSKLHLPEPKKMVTSRCK